MSKHETILFEKEDKEGLGSMSSPESALVTWIMDHVSSWEEHRDHNHKEKWLGYNRLWRGIHSPADQSRKSERSKLISPALSQAIEVAVAEQEEAVFGRGRWFDIQDDVQDEDESDVIGFRNLLTEDLDKTNIRSVLSEIFLNGAICGTGIGKVVIEQSDEREVIQGDLGIDSQETTKIVVKLVAIHPLEFAIDPLARNLKEALGMAHTPVVPKHVVVAKQRKGIYKKGALGSFSDDSVIEDSDIKYTKDDGKTRIVEYHGLVPQSLFTAATLEIDEDEEELADLSIDEDIDVEDDELIECIITIGNDRVLLKAVENPHIMRDRDFLAYQHDTIPNQFYGRGIAEKEYHPQKALDAELRGRIDAMSLAIHPMVAIDSSRMPRGETFTVRPGKTVLTQGDPRTVLMPFNFGQVNSATFPEAGELERMIQMGTGSMDSATGVGSSPRNQTASGMSMIASGSIRRSKRTMANIEKNLIEPLVHKASWRYMQFDPERYGQMDIKFKSYSTLGLMARELEQQNLSNLLKTVPSDSPAYWMLIKSFFNNSAIEEKESMLGVVDQMLQNIMNPKPDPIEEKVKQLSVEAAVLNNQKIESEIAKNIAQATKDSNDTGDDGRQDVMKSHIESQLKVALNEMDNETKLKIAMIAAETDIAAENIRTESNKEQKPTMVHQFPSNPESDEKLDTLEELVGDLTGFVKDKEEDRKEINKTIFEYLEGRGGEVAELVKELKE